MKRTQLKRRVPLERKSELKPGEPPARKTRINPVSPKQRRINRLWSKVSKQRRQDVDGWCEAQIENECVGQGDQGHHVLPRRHGDHSYENCRWLCWRCHDWVHREVKDAEKLGLIRREEAAVETEVTA